MLNDADINQLLDDLKKLYGYNFSYYSRDSLKRRISKIFRLEKYASFAEFRERVCNDKNYIEHLIDLITVNVTEMFRDPEFFRELKQTVFPHLQSLPGVRIWHAGCSSGEEIYSLVILLHEAGLLDKTLLFGTDINSIVLDKASKAVYPESLMPRYVRNYQQAGGEKDLMDYFSLKNGQAVFSQMLRKKVFFKAHNLASDLFIGKFHLVICRNVLIYFDRLHRDHVFDLFDLSLNPGGYLGLGEKETLRSSPLYKRYEQTGKEKIWKKVR